MGNALVALFKEGSKDFIVALDNTLAVDKEWQNILLQVSDVFYVLVEALTVIV